ncbi:unnamed protein product [Allacma fusca]|uniref:Uncharacterized protein n=1 Tax=Allacma fusca TaxID=39272 RepID=A0A8J2NU25_9HEXA|nr:unnamed protein product [Allacma fusca]
MDKPPPPPKVKPGFFQNNKVFIIGIPAIVGLHYAWYRMQYDPRIVPEHQRQKFPLIRVGRMIKEKFGF